MAAAPCPMKVKEEVVRIFGPVLYEFYGSTELGIAWMDEEGFVYVCDRVRDMSSRAA